MRQYHLTDGGERPAKPHTAPRAVSGTRRLRPVPGALRAGHLEEDIAVSWLVRIEPYRWPRHVLAEEEDREYSQMRDRHELFAARGADGRQGRATVRPHLVLR